MAFEELKKQDPCLYNLLKKEIKRQQNTIDLIPSECLVPLSILEVLGSPLTNKYSEGRIGKRYYPGNDVYDEIESLAKQRAKALFGLNEDWEVNVQALSGGPANLAIYFGLLLPGQTIMGMQLPCGGHLSHGHKVNASGQIWRSVQYGIKENGELDFAEIENLAQKEKPKIIVSGFTAFPLQIDFAKFGKIAKENNAWHLADISHIAGLIAAGLHPSPFPYADIVMTTTHKTLNGPRGAIIFARKEVAEKINRGVFPGLQGGPHNNNIAAIALCLQIAQTTFFKETQRQILQNARALAHSLLRFDFELIGGGTNNHLLLLDLTNKNVSGLEAQNILEKAGILANRNPVPKDKNLFSPSGIRMGTPSITFRGMKEEESQKIGEWIGCLLTKKEKPESIKIQIQTLCARYKLPYDY